MDPIVFDNNEKAYIKWLNNNDNGFVVNTSKANNRPYFMIHTASCSHISQETKGSYTFGLYRKVCSKNLSKLSDWFYKNNNYFCGEFKICKTCNPLIPFTERSIVYPNEIDLNESSATEIWEGAKIQVTINRYERDLRARKKCLHIWGYRCSVCDINFLEKYGEIGENFIHVHHLKELNKIKKEYKVDPENDLRPVCPNCHAMLHKRKPCYSIDELKKHIKSTINSRKIYKYVPKRKAH